MTTSPVINGQVKAPRAETLPLRSMLQRPVLRFSPTAWSKLLYLRDRGPVAIGAFGVASAHDPLLVTELRLVRQHSFPDSLTLDEAAVAAYLDEQTRFGRQSDELGRIWIRIGAVGSVTANQSDAQVCARYFLRADWFVLFLVERNGKTSARLYFQVGPGGALPLPVTVDFQRPFAASAVAAWEQEYRENILTDMPF